MSRVGVPGVTLTHERSGQRPLQMALLIALHQGLLRQGAGVNVFTAVPRERTGETPSQRLSLPRPESAAALARAMLEDAARALGQALAAGSVQRRHHRHGGSWRWRADTGRLPGRERPPRPHRGPWPSPSSAQPHREPSDPHRTRRCPVRYGRGSDGGAGRARRRARCSSYPRLGLRHQCGSARSARRHAAQVRGAAVRQSPEAARPRGWSGHLDLRALGLDTTPPKTFRCSSSEGRRRERGAPARVGPDGVGRDRS